MRKILQKARKKSQKIGSFSKKQVSRGKTFLLAYPMKSFFILLTVMFILIIAGNVLRKPPQTKAPTPTIAKKVSVFTIGEIPKVNFPASVEKSGSIKLSAATAGYLQKIFKQPGQAVSKGQWIGWISSSSTGGTISTVSRQIAQKSNIFTKETYDTQRALISKRKELAEKADSSSDDLAEITKKSVDETNDLISLNDEILGSINAQLSELESTNVGGANDALILQSKQGKAAVVSALNSLRSSVRNSQYQIDSEKAPAQISNLTKDMTLLQLSIEEKSLELSREISELNLKIAQISESLSYPASPCDGTIERIYGKVGQSVSPGATIASIACKQNHATIVVSVARNIAQTISRTDKSVIHTSGKTIETYPSYVSSEPTDGSLYSIQYVLDDKDSVSFGDGSSIIVSVPVGSLQSSRVIPFVPLDAIYQSQSGAYLYLVSSESGTLRASVRKVNLGSVYSDLVEVVEGLSQGDRIITDRSVIDGNEVTTQ